VILAIGIDDLPMGDFREGADGRTIFLGMYPACIRSELNRVFVRLEVLLQ
jgi:hypothetical protein